MGVSPKLVCGAWVGGEYRSIHFRTGALGQGSRTALPICGYFLQSVLSDKRFSQYHGKFAAPRDADITPDQYANCSYTYSYNDSDSIGVDSLSTLQIEREVELDQDGNPVVRPATPGNVQETPAPDQPKAAEEQRKKPQYEEVYY